MDERGERLNRRKQIKQANINPVVSITIAPIPEEPGEIGNAVRIRLTIVQTDARVDSLGPPGLSDPKVLFVQSRVSALEWPSGSGHLLDG